ncbi:hypothetical protein B0H11DRAFT_66121 [Mycena galericulata]|nr:hypothetical protein B0H11DRAFT_66121 [Mycena galericulata]
MMYIQSMIMPLLILSMHVIGQTLYDVSPFSTFPVPSGVAVNQPLSLSISAAGVGADGETTYVAVAVESAGMNRVCAVSGAGLVVQPHEVTT